MSYRVLVVLLCTLAALTGAVAQTSTPPVPSDLTAQVMPDAVPVVKLAWTAPAGPWGYIVYRSVDDSTGFQKLAMVNTTVFFDHLVRPGHVYYYYVTSVALTSANVPVQSDPSPIVRCAIGTAPDRPVGAVAGTITDDATGNPIPGILVRFLRKGPSLTNWQPMAVTDTLGMYAMKLDTGAYLVRTESLRMSPMDYIHEWFDNVTDIRLATPVVVTEGATSTANFGLSKPVPPVYSTIGGTVTDTLGNPLRHATVVIMRSIQELNTASALAFAVPGMGEEAVDVEGVGYTRGVIWKGYTDSLGQYKARVIDGKMYVAMASRWGYIPEFYDNKPNALLVDIIKVSGDVTDVNFSLAPVPVAQNSISGMVQDSTGTGVPSIIVLFPVRTPLLPVLPPPIRFGHTDSAGAYTIGNVRTGRYFVLAVPFGKYAPAFYKAGAYGVLHMARADTVLVSGDVGGITIGVVRVNSSGIARLRGRIFAGGLPAPGVRVLASVTGGTVVGAALTDNEGTYTMEAVPAGTMTVSVDAPDLTAADRNVNVPASAFEVNGIDFTMQTGGTTGSDDATVQPSSFALHQNYPNPFNPSTTISFDVPVAGWAKLTVFNTLGQEVGTLLNAQVEAGRTSVVWHAAGRTGITVASGVYFYRLSVDGPDGRSLYRAVRPMVLAR